MFYVWNMLIRRCLLLVACSVLLLGCASSGTLPGVPDQPPAEPEASPQAGHPTELEPTPAPEGTAAAVTPTAGQAAPLAQLAFASTRESGSDIYLVNADGSGLANLTNDPATDSEPAWSPDGQQLVFVSDRGEYTDLYRLDLEAGDDLEAASLTDSELAESSPAWSPDGNVIAFVAEDESIEGSNLFLLDLETSEAITLTSELRDVANPAWAPDGSRIALSSTHEGNRDIYSVGISVENDERQVGRIVNLTNAEADDDFPAWSPDGSRIAFTSDRAGDLDIYTMNADGTAQTRLTEAPAIDQNPHWSNDGTMLLFTSAREGSFDIFRMSDSGADIVRLTENTAADTTPIWRPEPAQPIIDRIAFSSDQDGRFSDILAVNVTGSNLINLTTNVDSDDTTPAWSPDGSRVAFTSARTNTFDIWVMNPDGSEQSNLTNHPANDGNIAWSPDGTRIAFVSDRDGNLEIYTMNRDGSEIDRLTNNPANDVFPRWSPDGSQIVFRSNRNGNNEIYVMNSNGLNRQRLTNNEHNDDHPAWSPDGTRIVFASNRPTEDEPDDAIANEGGSRLTSGLFPDPDFNLYVMNADGSQQTQVTSSVGDDQYPAWRPYPE